MREKQRQTKRKRGRPIEKERQDRQSTTVGSHRQEDDSQWVLQSPNKDVQNISWTLQCTKQIPDGARYCRLTSSRWVGNVMNIFIFMFSEHYVTREIREKLIKGWIYSMNLKAIMFYAKPYFMHQHLQSEQHREENFLLPYLLSPAFAT